MVCKPRFWIRGEEYEVRFSHTHTERIASGASPETQRKILKKYGRGFTTCRILHRVQKDGTPPDSIGVGQVRCHSNDQFRYSVARESSFRAALLSVPEFTEQDRKYAYYQVFTRLSPEEARTLMASAIQHHLKVAVGVRVSRSRAMDLVRLIEAPFLEAS